MSTTISSTPTHGTWARRRVALTVFRISRRLHGIAMRLERWATWHGAPCHSRYPTRTKDKVAEWATVQAAAAPDELTPSATLTADAIGRPSVEYVAELAADRALLVEARRLIAP